MTLLKICGAALIVLVFLLVVRTDKGSAPVMGAVVGAAAGVILLGLILARAAPIVSFINQISAETPFAPVVGVMLKALGITLIAEGAAGTCRDAGEPSLGDKVEFAGRIEVLLLCLPLLSALLALSKEILG